MVLLPPADIYVGGSGNKLVLCGVVSLYGKKGVGQFKARRFDLFRFLFVDIVLGNIAVG